MNDTKVTAGLEYLVNMGNFENVKVIVHVTDSPRNGENAREAFDRVYDFVYGRLEEKVKETHASLKE